MKAMRLNINIIQTVAFVHSYLSEHCKGGGPEIDQWAFSWAKFRQLSEI